MPWTCLLRMRGRVVASALLLAMANGPCSRGLATGSRDCGQQSAEVTAHGAQFVLGVAAIRFAGVVSVFRAVRWQHGDVFLKQAGPGVYMRADVVNCCEEFCDVGHVSFRGFASPG